MEKKRVIVVGAGPAGLAAAWELVNAGHYVTVLESDPEYVGGLARTIRYNGFRFDIGAHRFFSKNPEIVRWWRERLPKDFVTIKRLTRILYRQRFFEYPLKPGNALAGLGILTGIRCILSYLWRQVCPIRPERSFEDWVVNRFGDRLYHIFFKTYTEKVWGIPCHEINADWASQRIRGLSLFRAIFNSFFGRTQPRTVKTLTDKFEYPRLGAGMLWEQVRDDVLSHGGRILMGKSVVNLKHEEKRIVSVGTLSSRGRVEDYDADEFIVSMPLRDCALALNPALDRETQEAANRLSYRDFILVALIVNRTDIFPDNWIYVHDPEIKAGRIENFNNWTQDMSGSPGATCLEFEYFCSKNDSFWNTDDRKILTLAGEEFEKLGLGKSSEIVDGCVVRIEKAYPVYDMSYLQNVAVIRKALARFENLQSVGRNGMHKYNNQDHSMLTGMLAARNLSGDTHDVWRVNTDAEYQEESITESGRQIPQRLNGR